jgi:hypothetical protein
MMVDQAKLQAQRSDGNVFAFRRLKWGDPPARFRLDSILRRRLGAPVEPLQTLLDDNLQDCVPVAADPPRDMFQAQPVTDLNERRMRERIVDAAVWGAAIVSVSALAAALIWIGWSQ